MGKGKALFPDDQALIKEVYLADEEAAKNRILSHRD